MLDAIIRKIKVVKSPTAISKSSVFKIFIPIYKNISFVEPERIRGKVNARCQ
jgi:hypothetical protein